MTKFAVSTILGFVVCLKLVQGQVGRAGPTRQTAQRGSTRQSRPPAPAWPNPMGNIGGALGNMGAMGNMGSTGAFGAMGSLGAMGSMMMRRDGRCKPGWMSLPTGGLSENSCFLASPQPDTFIGAASWCEWIDGAHLAEINGPFLNGLLTDMAQQKSPGKKFWIGLMDVELEGHFKWIKSAKLAHYRNFIGGYRVIPDPNKNCGLVDNKGMWIMEDCKALNHFICEK